MHFSLASMTKRLVRTYLNSLMLNVYITHVLTKLTENKYIFGLAICVQVWLGFNKGTGKPGVFPK